MKHSRSITKRYRSLLQMLDHRYERDSFLLESKYKQAVSRIRQRRERELRALPEIQPKRTHQESHVVRHCVTCSGEMLTATRENAERLVESYDLRGSTGACNWRYALAALRNERTKYCCYHCQTGYGIHSARCKLKSEVDRSIMEADEPPPELEPDQSCGSCEIHEKGHAYDCPNAQD